MSNNDFVDLDDLLDDAPLIVVEDDLDDITPEPIRLVVDDQPLDGLTTGRTDQLRANVSYLTEESSSYDPPSTSRLKLNQILRMELREHPVRLAHRLLADADGSKAPRNAIDQRLDEGRLIQLVSALQSAEAQVLEGSEVSVIIAAPVSSERQDSILRAAHHLNATPVDGIILLKVWCPEQDLRRGLLELGLREGVDYEFVPRNELLKYERQVLDTLLARRRAKSFQLKIIRRLSKKQANIPAK